MFVPMLSKSTEYAIRALVFIQLQNWTGRRPGVAEVAREIDAPAAFTAKILHILTTQRLLLSMKGRGGGFFFPGMESDLSIHRVILVMEGDHLFTQCGIGLRGCSDANPCPVHEHYGVIREQLLDMATRESIRTMADKIREGRAVISRLTMESSEK
ncbi:MAG: Rrf2 family transcriptional regulator [Bacteroidales bacterium]